MTKEEKQARQKVAFENAKDYMYYGYSKSEWIENWHNCWLNKEDSDKVRKKAFYEMAKF